MIALWVSTSYLIRHGKNRFGSLLTAIPAYFMSAVSMTYILMAPEGFRLSSEIAYPVGMLLAATLLAAYLVCLVRKRGSGQTPEII